MPFFFPSQFPHNFTFFCADCGICEPPKQGNVEVSPHQTPPNSFRAFPRFTLFSDFPFPFFVVVRARFTNVFTGLLDPRNALKLMFPLRHLLSALPPSSLLKEAAQNTKALSPRGVYSSPTRKCEKPFRRFKELSRPLRAVSFQTRHSLPPARSIMVVPGWFHASFSHSPPTTRSELLTVP